MKYDPTIHHRRSIRLRGYDYSQAGAYFVTICTHRRRCIFGQVENKEMILNEYGVVAYQEWEKLPDRWPHIALGAFQVMPNHMHGIIIIRDPVGAPLAGAQLAGAQLAPNRHTIGESGIDGDVDRAPARGAPTGVPTEKIKWALQPTLGQIVGAYLSCVYTACLQIAKSKQPEERLGKLWQRNYWEHIIRNVTAFDRISNYIICNPENWGADKFHYQK